MPSARGVNRHPRMLTLIRRLFDFGARRRILALLSVHIAP
jgi:hypothetical protein